MVVGSWAVLMTDLSALPSPDGNPGIFIGVCLPCGRLVTKLWEGPMLLRVKLT